MRFTGEESTGFIVLAILPKYYSGSMKRFILLISF